MNRIVLLIDGLGSGGAQRQFVLLCNQLYKRGYNITIIAYLKDDFYNKFLNDNIKIITISWKNRINRIFKIRKEILKNNPNVLIAFLENPSIIAEITSITLKKTKIIVSERTGKKGILTKRDFIRFQFHRFADFIVTNSFDLSKYVEHNAPWLKQKIVTILNEVDKDLFTPCYNEGKKSENFRINIIGHYSPHKNQKAILEAFIKIKRLYPNINLEINCYGNNHYNNGSSCQESKYFDSIKERIINESIINFNLYQEVSNIKEVYKNSEVICLPSFYEGMPNVLCEAICCAIPIIASNVNDNNIFVKDSINGYLFDPNSIDSIVEVIMKIYSLTEKDLKSMSDNSYQLSQTLFKKEMLVDGYVNLFN